MIVIETGFPSFKLNNISPKDISPKQILDLGRRNTDFDSSTHRIRSPCKNCRPIS
ncbi:MAG: hypothetical protein RR250_07955 [Akkermansia sp.]